MKNIQYILLLVAAYLTIQACSKEEEYDLTRPYPSVKFAFDTLFVDLNKIDNPPVVAFVKSEIGLKEVDVKIKTIDSDIINYSTVNDFFNNNAYSLSASISYQSTYKSVMIKAVDKAGRSTEKELPLDIVQVKLPPKITFSVDSIVYNELVGGNIPDTEYWVESDAGLVSIEMFFATDGGQVEYGEAIELIGHPKTYNFSQNVEYAPSQKGFIVRATDVYGQVSIETLPFKYVEIPPPSIIIETEDTVAAAHDDPFDVLATISALGGIESIEIIRSINTGSGLYSEVLHSEIFNGTISEYKVNYSVNLTRATSAIIVKAINTIGKETLARISAIVDMQFAPEILLGGHRYNVGLIEMPGVYPLLSLKDMRTYSMDYFTMSKENSANIDIKMYVNYSTSDPWPISIVGNGGGNTTHDNMFKDSQGVVMDAMTSDKKYDNDTRFRVMSNFDFDNATSESINAIDLSTITELRARYTDVNTVIAFKTASTSSSGGDRVGLMKEIGRIFVTPPAGYGSYAPQFEVSVFSIKFPHP